MKPVDIRWPLSRRRGHHRRGTAAVAGLTALVLHASLLTAASAAPPPAVEQSAVATPTSGAAAETHQVTLITGDRVDLTSFSDDGPYQVEVEAAQRPAGTVVTHVTQTTPDGVYVLPSDALPALQSGHLDRELFNVSYLIESGYADTESDTLPVIITYPEPVGAASRGFTPQAEDLSARTESLPGATDPVALPVINGAGVEIQKSEAADFWQKLHPAAAPEAGIAARIGTAGTPVIWLDQIAHLTLDESTPLIGAHDAWTAGYDGTGVTVAVLDTGVDTEHPDLVDQLLAAESFVEGMSAQDGNGHGTHVAATVLGTGAASDGQYVGVAPGATLVSGRVCNDAGRCSFSSLIAGIEWAAVEMGADVVSMSLSSGYSDGTDPLSQAVDRLSETTGALFVAAAGNNGVDVSVGSPAAADSALAVAATTKTDALASFSSRGPRWGDMALKPDIAAPGVDIVAARASGTGAGVPVNEWYTSLQGTSMATPHVAGAAAILAQAYPQWSPAELKAALMSTAHDAGHTVYQQGAGRVDLARAVTQQVVATTGNLDYGLVEIPRDGEPEPAPITRTVSYRNLSDAPVTLSLSASLAAIDGDPVPAEALTLPETVTVPEQQTVTVEVTLTVAGLERGRYSGAVVATDATGAIEVNTPVGLVRDPPKYDLVIQTIGRDGEPLDAIGTDLIDLTGPDGLITELSYGGTPGTVVARVPKGSFSVTQLVRWVDEDSRINNALLFQPQVQVDGDTEVVLDARDANQITFDTPLPSEPLNNYAAMAYQRTTGKGDRYSTVVQSMAPTGAWARLWATSTEPVDIGEFRFWSQWLLGQSEVELAVSSGRSEWLLDAVAPLHEVIGDGNPNMTGGQVLAQDGHPGWVPFVGSQQLQLVDVGTGSAEELDGLDLSGKLALLVADGFFQSPIGGATCGVDVDQLRRVRDAGAAGVVVYPNPDPPGWSCPGADAVPVQVVQEPFTGERREIGIPNVSLSTREALQLRELLAEGPVTIHVHGTPETPYTYVLKPYEEGWVPDSLHYTFTEADLGRVELEYHASDPETTFYENRYVWKPDDAVIQHLPLATGAAPAFIGPRTRIEYFGPVSDQVLHNRSGYLRQGGLDPVGYANRMWRDSAMDLFLPPAEPHQHWYLTPKSPGPQVATDAVHQLANSGVLSNLGTCYFCRQGGFLFGFFPMVTGGQQQWQSDGGSGSVAQHSAEEGYFDLEIALRHDGEPVQSVPGLPWPLFMLPAESGQYELTVVGPQTDATWTYTSGAPEEDTRQPGYECFPEMVLGITAPCAPEPLVFVNYDLSASLAMDNTVRAPGAQWFTVHAYHAPSTAPMPEIAGVRVWASYDGGNEWTQAQVRAEGDGEFSVKLVHPPAQRRASDQVTLKVEAWDEAGNRLEQITRDAYTLRGVTDLAPAAGEHVLR